MRRAVATIALLAASLALGGCFTIRSASLAQQDVTGPVQIRTEVCLRSQTHPAEPAPGLSCRSDAPDATTPDTTDHDLQLFYAYLVDEGATGPASFTGEGALSGVAFTEHPDFAARLAERPGQAAIFGTKWVAYASTRVPQYKDVTAPVNGVIAPAFQPAATAATFSARVVQGWRWVRDEPGYDLARPVACGDPMIQNGFTRDPTPAADCGDDTSAGPIESNYFPRRTGADPANPFSYPRMTLPVAAATIAAPFAGAAIDAGQATSVRFGVTSRAAPGVPPEIPVIAGTTIPGGTVALDRTSLPLGAGVDAITAEVAAPPGTPTGIYELVVAVGSGSGQRAATTFVGVTAPGAPQNPAFVPSGLLTAKQTAALLRPLLRQASAGRKLRKGAKVVVRIPHQEGVRVRVVLRRSGKKGRTVAQGRSSRSTRGRDKIVLKATKYGRQQLRPGRTWKGRLVVTLRGGERDDVNESFSLKVPRR